MLWFAKRFVVVFGGTGYEDGGGMEGAGSGCGGAPMWVVQLAGIVQLTKARMRPLNVSF
jgi:hypothetical protein